MDPPSKQSGNGKKHLGVTISGQLKLIPSEPKPTQMTKGRRQKANYSVMSASSFDLPYFQASLFATALEDTITQLKILDECNTEMRVSKTKSDMGLLLALKYGVAQPAMSDELQGIDPKRLACNEYKLNKLDADRKYANDVLIAVYMDLSLHRSSRELFDRVNRIEERKHHREFITADEMKNRVTRRELQRQLRQQRNHIKSVTYDTNSIIDVLKTQLEDSALMGEIRSRYVDNWQRARTEQHIQQIGVVESTPTESIEYFKRRTDHEHRVHSEIELLTNITINETLEKVERWMEKYDRDMEQIDLKIQIKKNDYQDMLSKRRGLAETIENHNQLIKSWVDFKDERERARRYRVKMTTSAIIVQAWWRGLLVRKQLGPYKPKKKPVAKKK